MTGDRAVSRVTAGLPDRLASVTENTAVPAWACGDRCATCRSVPRVSSTALCHSSIGLFWDWLCPVLCQGIHHHTSLSSAPAQSFRRGNLQFHPSVSFLLRRALRHLMKHFYFAQLSLTLVTFYLVLYISHHDLLFSSLPPFSSPSSSITPSVTSVTLFATLAVTLCVALANASCTVSLSAAPLTGS